MKTAFIAFAAFALTATSAIAGDGDPFTTGDSYGPHQPSGETAGYARPARPAKAQALPWASQPWVKDASPKGLDEPSAAALAAQIAGYTAHARRTYDWVVENGGCNAPVIPFEYASYCDKDAFGWPMGSN